MTAMAAREHPQDLEKEDDRELMALVKNGRKEAFVVLVRRHQNPLLNFFRGLGVYNDAEDLVQDTFIRLYKYRERYKPTAKLTTFLYLLARQVRIDMLRKMRRREEFKDTLIEESLANEKAAKGGSKKTIDVESALEKLPETMRSVVVLNIYQSLKYQEIAAVLEIPLGTVKSRMFQALRRLKDMIDTR